jgi:hypothetical protein
MDQAPSTEDRVSVLADAVRVRELVAVLRACEDAGAQPVVFKGAALAHTHYADSWRRPRDDADLLIAPDTRERVFDVLRTLGYQRPTFISGELVMYQAPFERVDQLGIDHALDIHWRTADPQVVSLVLTHQELVERSVLVSVQGYPMRVPSPVDSLLLACIHRVAHHPDIEKLVWIEDIHLVARRLGPSEWQAFVERATSGAVRAICLEGLTRARERFQTVVPPDVLTALSGGHNESSSVFLREDLRPVDRLKADVRALRLFAAARLVREHLFPPAEYMRAAYGVRNRAWLPAYYLARLLRGMSKWMRPYVSATR